MVEMLDERRLEEVKRMFGVADDAVQNAPKSNTSINDDGYSDVNLDTLSEPKKSDPYSLMMTVGSIALLRVDFNQPMKTKPYRKDTGYDYFYLFGVSFRKFSDLHGFKLEDLVGNEVFQFGEGTASALAPILKANKKGGWRYVLIYRIDKMNTCVRLLTDEEYAVCDPLSEKQLIEQYFMNCKPSQQKSAKASQNNAVVIT